MKKSKIIIILLILSVIATSYRIYESFFKTLKLVDIPSTGDSVIDLMLNESKRFLYQKFLFQQDFVNKIIVIFLILLLILSLLCYIKDKFNIFYIAYTAYILLSFFKSIYYFLNVRKIIDRLTFPDNRNFTNAGLKISFNFSVFLTVLYLGIIFYYFYKGSRRSTDDI